MPEGDEGQDLDQALDDGGQPAGEGGGVERARGEPEPDPAETEPTTTSSQTLEDALGQELEGEAAKPGEGGEPEEGGEEGPAPDEAVHQDEIDADFLPEGYSVDEEGRVHRADGTYASKPEIDEALEQTAEEAENFFGEGEEPEEEETEEPEVEPLEVELDEDESLEIEVEDEETREALRDRLEKADRVEEVEEQRAELEEMRAEVQAAKQAQQELEEHIRSDPVGFVLDELPEERRDRIAVNLLYDDEVFEAVTQKIQEWQRDPSKREIEAERSRRKRLEEQYERDQRRKAERARVEAAQEIVSRVKSMVPEDLSPELKERFLHDSVRDIQDYVDRNDLYPSDFDMEKIPEIISSRLDLYGIDPEQITENGGPPEGSGVTKAEPRGEAAEELAEEAERYRRTGERLRKARARKKAAASSTPPGAGSGPTGPQLGEDATLDDALDAMERRAG